MKTHIFAFFIAISLLFFACNTDEKLSSQTEDVLPESGILELTRPIQVGPEARSVSYSLIAKFDMESEKLISYSVSPELLKSINMSAEELDNYLKEKMGTIYYLGDNPVTRGEHANCIEMCKDKYTDSDGNKIKGRGACKANCWVDTIVEVLKSIAQVA